MPRPVSTLDKSIYIHQFNYGTNGDSWPAIVAKCRAAGANLIKLKAVDGVDWMAAYDLMPDPRGGHTEAGRRVLVPTPFAVSSGWQWSQLAAEAKRQGAQLIPWCVPHGQELEAELAILNELAQYSDGLIELDIEPYAGFWQSTPARLIELVQGIFERSIQLWVDVDIRPYAASQLPLVEMADYVTRWLSQSYWTTFQVAARGAITADADLFAGLPAGDWGAILPAGGLVDFQPAAEVAAERDAAELGLWSYNVAGGPAFKAFREIK